MAVPVLSVQIQDFPEGLDKYQRPLHCQTGSRSRSNVRKNIFHPLKDVITIKLDGDLPIVAAAIHNGHKLSEDLINLSALDESTRLREEDPFTGLWTNITDNRIIVHRSRFEFDLNRSPEKAIYLEPSDAWGLRVWKIPLSDMAREKTMKIYNDIYQRIREGIIRLVKKFGIIVMYDLHSYNYRRGGPDAPPEDPVENPEINLGTETLNRDNWAPVIDRFMHDMRNFDFMGRQLDIRENIKFIGGYFPRWIHENFPESVCCLSIDIKKFFMDEWTNQPDHTLIMAIEDALRATIPGILDELSKLMKDK